MTDSPHKIPKENKVPENQSNLPSNKTLDSDIIISSLAMPYSPIFYSLNCVQIIPSKKLFNLQNLITHLADQLEAARRLSHGRGTREIIRLTERILNAQADYQGMTGGYFKSNNRE